MPGGLIGGMMMTTGVLIFSIAKWNSQSIKIGKAIIKDQKTEKIYSVALEVRANEKMINDVKEMIDSNRYKPSKIGKLFLNVQSILKEQADNLVMNILTKKLIECGINGEKRYKTVELINKEHLGESLKFIDRRFLSSDPAIKSIYQEMIDYKTGKRIDGWYAQAITESNKIINRLENIMEE